ncbi:MAG: SufD family Fe-S cluster assembly protein [Clostridia bacterium]|jgi:Fe-S cluster assembly scaffold protein SufB|nr:SufD family Fe-S cluster assembly protein [Clostridia bacterium]
MNEMELKLLHEIADLDGEPTGAYNIRKNGALESRASTEHILIQSKPDKPGIDIHIAPGTKGERVYIPVLLTESGRSDLVYNDFYIGEDCDVDIVAGCGIHNIGSENSQHDGIHTFYMGKNARVRYAEKHYGEGEGTGKRILNPQTIVHLDEGAFLQMDTVQIRGVDSTQRETTVTVGNAAEVVINEKLLTHGQQTAESTMEIRLEGVDAKGRVISRSVAQDSSQQTFYPKVTGSAKCFGHVQCDSIIMGESQISAIPAITAEHVDAQLIHEAAIGRIAGDQIMKLMTLGLTEAQAEERILEGFLQ